jgi:hypothetical protein
VLELPGLELALVALKKDGFDLVKSKVNELFALRVSTPNVNKSTIGRRRRFL